MFVVGQIYWTDIKIPSRYCEECVKEEHLWDVQNQEILQSSEKKKSESLQARGFEDEVLIIFQLDCQFYYCPQGLRKAVFYLPTNPC